MTWLTGQTSNGITVKTVQQVIGGTFKPGVTVNPPAPAAAGVNALENPSLDDHRLHHRVPEVLAGRRLGHQHGGLGQHRRPPAPHRDARRRT